MDIFVCSDESGVFDKYHNEYFVFGGLVFLSKQEKDNFARQYLNAERVIRETCKFPHDKEITAATVSNGFKSKLFRSANKVEKFGIVVRQQYLLEEAFASKKTKQRYLDWAYKMSIKYKFERLIERGSVDPGAVEHIYFFVDEHTTATDGIYELKESLEQEFRFGAIDYRHNTFHSPLFENLKGVQVAYRDSATTPLVRAADIVANRLYHMAVVGDYRDAVGRHFDITSHPPLSPIVLLDEHTTI